MMMRKHWAIALCTGAMMSCGLGVTTAHADITFTDLYKLSDVRPSQMPDGAREGQVVGDGMVSNHYHAFLRTGTNAIDLNPAGFEYSAALSIGGSQQVGYGIGPVSNNRNHALLWTGTADSAIDLNPAGYDSSQAYGCEGSQQVGWSLTTSAAICHASLWTGTAESAVDLNPAGIEYSTAIDTDGSQQVGQGVGSATGNQYHAFLWSGTANSAVDLNPAGFSFSSVIGVGGSQQVGYGQLPVAHLDHALLWTGSAASVVDLHPAGLDASEAINTDGGRQVGYGYNSAAIYQLHALLWNGSATDFVDLGSLMPSNFIRSQALCIDGNTIYGIATDTDYHNHAVQWTIVPEPASLSLIGLGALGLLRRRRNA